MLLLPLVLLALAWIQESLDQFLFGGRWALPMVHGGPFWGVLTAPFSHSDWSHLVSNSLWFLPLSILSSYSMVFGRMSPSGLVFMPQLPWFGFGCLLQAMVSPVWSMGFWAISC